MKTNKLLLFLLILALSFTSYGQNPFTEMLNDPATRAVIDSDIPTRDQVFLDDLIVDGSACIGQDCVNGESFGFDTIRLKENNLRIKFDDTSNSASFPSNDWQLTANDSSNGGDNKFSIDDITGGKTPFTTMAGAPSHSLFIDRAGRIGLGTSTPVVEVHVKDGDSPTMRLEQDGSSGFGQQTWDVAGNETNFFVRDVTNGSKLPFRIRPSAPTNSIYIDADGDIGLGTASPTAKLQLETGDLQVKAGDINMLNGNVNVTTGMVLIGGVNASSTQAGFHIKQQVANSASRGMIIESATNGSKGVIYKSTSSLVLAGGAGGNSTVSMNPTGTGFVGIGTESPATRLDVNGVITTPGGNSDDWNAIGQDFRQTTREMAALQTQVNELMKRIETMESCGCYNEVTGDEGRAAISNDASVTANKAYLSQNIPNPFDNTTSISYFIPFVNTSANIVISNATGQILENRSIDKLGKGSVIVNKARMSTGIYFYTLYADGKKIDTKRMVVE